MKRPTSRARQLRETQTPAEQLLWRELRNRQVCGCKWRRQQPIDNYIVDFFCPELRFVIELDGDIHAIRKEQDRTRQKYLEDQGLRVIRFANNDIRLNIEGVLNVIWQISEELKDRIALSSSP